MNEKVKDSAEELREIPMQQVIKKAEGAAAKIKLAVESSAKEIVTQIYLRSAPGQCTWGDNWATAHRELFEDFQDSMEETVARELWEMLEELI